MRSSGTALLLGLFLGLAPSCGSVAEQRHEEVRQLAEEQLSWQREWGEAQERFARENPMPQELPRGIHGTLLLHEAELTGRRGGEKLRLKFTFLNTTGVSMRSAELRLVVRDDRTGEERSSRAELRLPFGVHLEHNSSYTGSVEVPLEGLYRRPDWSWRVELTAVERDVPPGVDRR
jgi:hypothetical protein